MAPFTPDVLPKDAREAFDGLSDAGRAKWMEDRLKGQTDHLFLGCELMGYDFVPNPHAGLFKNFLQKDPEQKKHLYELDDVCHLCRANPRDECTICHGTGRHNYKKRMILWPRGLFKTSATVVEMVQLILNFPNIRILILSGNKILAKRQLARVKRVFEQPSAKFKQLYPEFCGEKLGNSEEFTVPCRTLQQFAEPTVAISTAKCVNSGSHFDVIFVDDLVHDQNYQNPKLLEKCWQEYLGIGPLLQPSGFMFVTGTRYTFDDTYERVEAAALKEMEETGETVWKISKRSCWVRLCKTCGHPDLLHNSDLNYKEPPCTECRCSCFVDSGEKKVLFPQFITRDGRQEGHSVKYLESEKREKGVRFFSCQYENNPMATEEVQFTPELLNAQTFYHLDQMPVGGQNFLMGDLALVGKEESDQSVLFLCRLAAQSLWVYKSYVGKWNADVCGDTVVNAIWQDRPVICWLEKFPPWDSYNNIFMGKAQALGMQTLPISWLPMSNKKDAKIARIGGIIPWLVGRKLWLFAGMSHYDELIVQLKRWPRLGRRDDLADNLGHVCEAPHGLVVTPVGQRPDPLAQVREIHKRQAERLEAETGLIEGGGCGSSLVC